jgi:hypothetical protein
LSNNGKTLTISHREHVMGLQSSAAGVTELDQRFINPGNPSMFPWLAQIAPSYESYLFKKLIFEYVPNCPATTAGSVVLAVDYDPRDEAEADIGYLMSMEGSMYGNCWAPFKHVSSKENLNKQKSYYTDEDLSDPTNRLNSIGRLIVALDRTSVNNFVGRIFVSYTVELRTPQPSNRDQDQLYFKNSNHTMDVFNQGTTRTWGYIPYSIVDPHTIKVIDFEGIMMIDVKRHGDAAIAPNYAINFNNLADWAFAYRMNVYHGSGAIPEVHSQAQGIYLIKTGSKESDCTLTITPEVVQGVDTIDVCVRFFRCRGGSYYHLTAGESGASYHVYKEASPLSLISNLSTQRLKTAAI